MTSARSRRGLVRRHAELEVQRLTFGGTTCGVLATHFIVFALGFPMSVFVRHIWARIV